MCHSTVLFLSDYLQGLLKFSRLDPWTLISLLGSRKHSLWVWTSMISSPDSATGNAPSEAWKYAETIEGQPLYTETSEIDLLVPCLAVTKGP